MLSISQWLSNFFLDSCTSVFVSILCHNIFFWGRGHSSAWGLLLVLLTPLLSEITPGRFRRPYGVLGWNPGLLSERQMSNPLCLSLHPLIPTTSFKLSFIYCGPHNLKLFSFPLQLKFLYPGS